MKRYQQESADEPSNAFAATLKAALELSPEERALLADQLLQSLSVQNQEEIDKAWVDEIEQRIREIDEGRVELIPGEEVLAKLRSRFKG